MESLIFDYKNFLLEHAHEINSDLYVFLVKILRELEEYIENGELINIYHSVNLQYKANVLNTLNKAFEDGGFSEQFDFYFYLYSNDTLNDRHSMLKNALLDIEQKVSSLIQKPVSVMDYFEQLVRLLNFDEYDEDGDNTELIEILQNTEEIKEMERMYNDSDIITFDIDDTEE